MKMNKMKKNMDDNNNKTKSNCNEKYNEKC